MNVVNMNAWSPCAQDICQQAVRLSLERSQGCDPGRRLSCLGRGGAMPKRASRGSVDVFVEIPKGSRAKYELDKATGRIRLDRVLFASVHYPADCGFITDTLDGDG